jgi:hypothetical protein
VKYPIIKISFGGGTVRNLNELRIHLNVKLEENAQIYSVELLNELPYDAFKELIIKLYNKFNNSVVVLIDEYDKPILDNITKYNVDEIREDIAGFYSVLKDSDQYLKFVFLTRYEDIIIAGETQSVISNSNVQNNDTSDVGFIKFQALAIVKRILKEKNVISLVFKK